MAAVVPKEVEHYRAPNPVAPPTRWGGLCWVGCGAVGFDFCVRWTILSREPNLAGSHSGNWQSYAMVD